MSKKTGLQRGIRALRDNMKKGKAKEMLEKIANILHAAVSMNMRLSSSIMENPQFMRIETRS